MPNTAPYNALRYHVTGAIQRGEKEAIMEQPTHSGPLRHNVPFLMGDRDLTSECERSANSGTEINDLAARAIAARLTGSAFAWAPACERFARDDLYERSALLSELSLWIEANYRKINPIWDRWADHLGTYLINRA